MPFNSLISILNPFNINKVNQINNYPYSLLWYDGQDVTTILGQYNYAVSNTDNVYKIINKSCNTYKIKNLISPDINVHQIIFVDYWTSFGKVVNNIVIYKNQVNKTGFITDSTDINFSNGFASFLVLRTDTINYPNTSIWCKCNTNNISYPFNQMGSQE